MGVSRVVQCVPVHGGVAAPNVCVSSTGRVAEVAPVPEKVASASPAACVWKGQPELPRWGPLRPQHDSSPAWGVCTAPYLRARSVFCKAGDPWTSCQ